MNVTDVLYLIVIALLVLLCGLYAASDTALSSVNMLRLEKEAQESASLLRIKDSFKKIIIVKDDIKPKRNEDGILTIGLKDFLLDKNSLNY